jgi:polyhydroxybutyrate depolymerase
MVRPLWVAFSLLLAIGAAGCARAAGGTVTQSIEVAGVTRTYRLHVPPNLSGRVPLILSFHGHGGQGASQERLTHMDELADRYGFIVAYPDGIDRGWNDGRFPYGADDLGFVAALQNDLERRYPIDVKRVYATGFSNGAIFSNYLACNQADRFAAIAPVSGTLPTAMLPKCVPVRNMPVLQIGGTADPIVPYQGGAIKAGGTIAGNVISFEQNAGFWSQTAYCAIKPVTTELPPVEPSDGTSVTRATYRACAPHIDVVTYTINGGGHAWPDGSQYLPRFLIGIASNQLDASETIVKFFLAHPMP